MVERPNAGLQRPTHLSLCTLFCFRGVPGNFYELENCPAPLHE